jgi:hypothetical protein
MKRVNSGKRQPESPKVPSRKRQTKAGRPEKIKIKAKVESNVGASRRETLMS